jgi:uncharacterized phage-associated protein
MYSALAIASKFIMLGIRDNKPVSPMKLQKLVYFAHGLHLAQYNKPLINEGVQAWEYGPVIPALYHQFKTWGNNPITESPRVGVLIGGSFTSGLDFLDDDAEQTIRIAWDITKDITASQLSDWSHNTGSPWSNTYDGTSSKKIKDQEIQAYFRTQMNLNANE